MKLSFARKEDEALLFTASSSSSSFTEGSGGGYGVLAIGLCDVAGAGVRALKSLTASSKSGKQLKRRDFELKFTDENGGDLVGKMIGNNNGEPKLAPLRTEMAGAATSSAPSGTSPLGSVTR